MCFAPELGLLNLELVYLWVIVKDLLECISFMRSLRVCGGINDAFNFWFYVWQILVFHVLACGKTAYSCLMEVY